ncbi:MAG: YbjQ family protein [Chloroflexi bacterium]|nr:YbjQ family protein [Chloroflexota bacterium]
MIIVTTDEIPGRRVTKVLGLVRGNSVRARHIGRDIVAALRNIVGGEVKEYAELMAQSREESVQRMVQRAEALGANAIVGTRFATSAIMSGAAEMLAYGTAVVVEEGG